MPWKTQEVEIDGNKTSLVVVDQAGNPIWIDEKGMETGQDVVRLRAQITEANNEAGKHRIRIKELEDAAAPFEGIDPEQAKKDRDTVANLQDKEIMEAGKVEQIKAAAVAEVNKAWETKFNKLDENNKTAIADLEAKTGLQDKTIRRLMVKGAFDASEFIKTGVAENYFPEVLYTMFGDRFEVRASENGGDPVVVAKGFNGEEIYSPANPRQLATPEEAIEVLVRSHPQSSKILKGSQASGSGAQPSGSGGAKTPLAAMKEQYAEAKKSGNTVAMVALKSKIFQEDPTFAG